MAVRATAAEIARLRYILRSMRSRKPTVREFALNEARALPLPQRELLARMTQRSFALERRRKAFLRLSAFYGSSTLMGLAIFVLHGIFPSWPLVEVVCVVGWLTVWSMADRAVREAFTPSWDARKVYLNEAEAQGIIVTASAAPDRSNEVLQSREKPATPDHESMGDRTRWQFAEILDRLNAENEAERQQAFGQTMLLTTEELLILAEMQFRRCQRQIEQEQNTRNKICNVAYWTVFAGILFHFMIGFPIAIVAGLRALYLRDRQVERALEGLVLLLRDLKELHPAPITLEMLTSEPDPSLLTLMKRRCPALETLVEDRWDESETEPLTAQDDLPALQAMSAETLLMPYENVADTLAALKRLARIGDETVLPVVERLAAAPVRSVSVRAPIQSLADYRRDTQRIREAAMECLQAMHARLDLQTRMLLRASEAPSISAPEMLLRPMAAYALETQPESLLRPHDPHEQEPVTAHSSPAEDALVCVSEASQQVRAETFARPVAPELETPVESVLEARSG